MYLLFFYRFSKSSLQWNSKCSEQDFSLRILNGASFTTNSSLFIKAQMKTSAQALIVSVRTHTNMCIQTEFKVYTHWNLPFFLVDDEPFSLKQTMSSHEHLCTILSLRWPFLTHKRIAAWYSDISLFKSRLTECDKFNTTKLVSELFSSIWLWSVRL